MVTQKSRSAVLVIGDVMLDKHIEGTMTRISPEAPAPVIKVDNVSFSLGGAGNVAANLASLGRKVYLLGSAGRDDAANIITQLCFEVGINLNLRGSDQPTTAKERITADGQQVLRCDYEAAFSTADTGFQYYLEAVRSLLTENTDIDIVVIADYNKGVMSRSLMSEVESLANKHDIHIYVDTKPVNLPMYKQADLLKPNLKEAMEMLPTTTMLHPGADEQYNSDTDRAVYCAKVLYSMNAATMVVVTAGAAGAVCVYGPPRDAYFVSSLPPQECFDVTGCGDTFMAVLVDSYLLGLDMPAAVLRANTAAAKVASKHGTATLTRDELEDAVLDRLGPSGKIMTLGQTLAFTSRQRALGKRIVFTNGTFRFIHHGHMETMRYAKRQGDILVVAINSDESIEKLKPGTKYVPQEQRAELLSHLPYVDVVLIFDDEDVTNTIIAITPNVLVKGAEYRETTIPGAEHVAKHGGKIMFSPMIDDFHASDLT